MIYQAAGQGKLILFGEHSAVYGHPAVGLPLNCRTVLTWNDTPVPNEPKTPDEIRENRETFIRLLKDAQAIHSDFPALRGTWHRQGNVPSSGGFGSSAALCIALARIVLRHSGSCYDPQVHHLAHCLETRFHGTPSGIDTGMAGDVGPAIWTHSKNMPIRMPLDMPPWHLIYGALPRSASTAQTVEKIAKLHRRGDKEVRAALESLGTIARLFIQESNVRHPDFASRAAQQVNHAQHVLKSLGLSIPELDKLIDRGIKAGAAGGKLSGGGLGGAFYLCATDRESRDRLLSNLSSSVDRHGPALTVPLTPLDILPSRENDP